jgi:hypothetical protein
VKGKSTSFPVRFLVLSLALSPVLFTCNPYERYTCTHYNIQLELDPGTAKISANMQMVLLARREYHDSICFRLNPDLRILSLAAQELEFYRFDPEDSGRLVLYIEEAVRPFDQLHISLSYSGRLSAQAVNSLDSTLLWYPVNHDTSPCTYMAKLALPGGWQVVHPEAQTGKHGKWQMHAEKPCSSIEIRLARR